MSIQFPANPQLNATFDYDGKTYIWDGEKWTASAIGSFDEAYVNIDGDTMTGDLTVPSLNGGPLAGMRNALINGDYAIAQRYGNYPWTATGVQANSNPESLFGPDRWSTPQFREFQSRSERPSNFFVGSIQWRTGTQSNAVWNQVIELEGDGTSVPRNDFLLGCDDWTISHWIFAADRNNFVCSVEYVNESYSPSVSQSIAAIADGDWQTVETQGDWIRVAASFSMSGVAGAPAGALGVRVQFRNDGNIRAVGAQLEPGSQPTPFEHRPIGTELALCQRYYFGNFQCSPPPRTSGGNLYNDCAGRFTLSVAMRITPTALNIKSEQTDFTSVAVAGVTPSVINASGTLGTGGISRLSVDLDAEL